MWTRTSRPSCAIEHQKPATPRLTTASTTSRRPAESGDTARLADTRHRMLSCFQLGFFLASWGMMRGSGDLYQRSVRDLLPVVEMVASEPASTWEFDAHCLATRTEDVLALSRRVRRAFTIPASDIL